MKRILTAMITVLTLMSYTGHTQGKETDVAFFEFYESIAIRDAQLEAILEFTSEEDESDYWKDQLNFEKRLKKEKYRAYKTYIFFKRKAYQEHQKECDIVAYHGNGYNKKALFYEVHGMSASLEQVEISRNTDVLPSMASKY
ncbi:hypothetical protein [Muriicola soli]|uniref:Uncharacterized protein n=1 Tax=Muriicola soli TaxID=2507538 RepID=A0A411E621_9FLAO|nr:hypothetical protein [Muriicola soli]QBA63155.1 hypothetical protein EQY75_00420 [Muriicola soli]